jgi:hypothetical protein
MSQQSLIARCTLSEQCLPDAPYRAMLCKLHKDMLDEIDRLKAARPAPVRDKSGTDYAKLQAKWRKQRQENANLQRAHLEVLAELASLKATQPAQEHVAWMHWLNGPCKLYMNKDDAMLELERLNREYPADGHARKMRPLVFGDTAPPAQPAPVQEPDYWLGYGLQAHTEKPFEDATPVWTSPPAAQPAPVREPVAMTFERLSRGMEILAWNRSQANPPIEITKEQWVANELERFYTTPPAAQPAVPLTDEQIDAATKAWFENDIVSGRYPFRKRMRAAFAAAHGITAAPEKGGAA